ncbi:MAG: hypothetical protein LBR57_02040 [Alistipes sp.]|nr:hypothetical protein [Alistipes sp.]
MATPYIKVELINCFYSHFANLALLDRVDYDTIGRLVADELTDDIYNKNLFDGIVPSEKSMALHNRDIPAIVATVRETVRRNRPRHRLKKLISHLIS